MTVMERLAHNLAVIRTKSGLSQTQLGKMAGVTGGAISGIERNANRTNVETLCSIAKALKTTPDVLLGVKESEAMKETRKELSRLRTENLALIEDIRHLDCCKVCALHKDGTCHSEVPNRNRFCFVWRGPQNKKRK